MTTNVARKCSTCGAGMQFVGYVDSKTGKELRIGFIEELMTKEYLTGDLRKYQCLRGHVETYRNEDLPVQEFQILGENDSFRNAKELVSYAKIHAETERALIRFDHLVCLAYIAGDYDLSLVKKKDVENKRQYVSLHSYPDITNAAKQGLETLPSDWLNQLSKQIETQE